MLPWILALLGIGAVVAGIAVVVVGGLLIGPFLVWLSWNVLGLAHAVGAGELGFWGLVLVALFLAVGLFGRAVIVAVIFLVDPHWLHASARLQWPAPTFKNYVAILLLLVVASFSAGSQARGRRTADGG
jgi:hypothetical protein